LKKPIVESDAEIAIKKQTELLQQLGEAYSTQLDDQMGLLYNQFVVYISTSKLPLPQVLLVLEMLVNETVSQAKHRYVDGGG
jgi:hypothetical protein